MKAYRFEVEVIYHEEGVKPKIEKDKGIAVAEDYPSAVKDIVGIYESPAGEITFVGFTSLYEVESYGSVLLDDQIQDILNED